MGMEADLLVDRRRLRRQLTFWRVAAALLLFAALSAGAMFALRDRLPTGSPHVARVKIEGLITGNSETLDLLRQVEKSRASALVLRIQSGGGTTAGSEALYHAVRRVAEKKPVVAVIDGVGASGAYMAALGGHRIVANGSAIVGSVGVIAQYPNLTKLLETLGVKVEAVRSSPLKAMPSGIEPTSPEARAALESTVLDTYRWFRDLVGERRKLTGDALAGVTDGRVFTGRQALPLGLVDAIGGEIEALAWLEKEKGLAPNAPVRDYKPRRGLERFPAISSLVARFGLAAPAEAEALAARILGPNALDGLVSVWHPSAQ